MATLTAQIRGNATLWASSLRARVLRRRNAVAYGDRVPEYGHLGLWSPVLFGAGIGLYFWLPTEPATWPVVTALIITVISTFILRRSRSLSFFTVAAVGMVAAGFGAAQLHTMTVSGPVLMREIGPVRVAARVIAVERTEKGVRLTLDNVTIDRRDIGEMPHRVRISVRSVKTAPLPGDRIEALAILQPPPSPSLPGGFDFARKAWFERIGGVGFALGAVTVTDRPEEGSWRIALARLRLDLTTRIMATAGDRIGPVAAALMTGERRAIPKDALASMRDSGLAHLLAISGLHIGLVAGLLFFVVRLGLAFIEPVALRYPIKKYAAVTAIAGAFAYLLISGATNPTQRAFLMVSIVMLAVLIDRTAISMRLVAISAIAVLLVAPESLLSASFQMSFAAVVGLVAVYEAAAPAMSRVRQRGGLLGSRVGLFIAATALTTLVAGSATAPFAIYHFNRVALYGLAANLVAVPVMAMWIMTFGILSFLLMPFGLESLGLVPMGWGIGIVLEVADTVAALPGAVALVPPMPTIGLAVPALGGLWLCLTPGRLRFYGIPVLGAGLLSIVAVTPPDVIVNRDGDLVAINLGKQGVAMSPGKGNTFERDMWRRRLAVSDVQDWPSDGVGAGGRLGCDSNGCILRIREKTVALVLDPAAAFEDCGQVDHVILLTRVPRGLCRDGAVILSTFHIWRDGAHAIRFTENGPVIETSRAARGDRPWSRIPDRKRQYLRTSPTSRP
jgi:competence protein ComEC